MRLTTLAIASFGALVGSLALVLAGAFVMLKAMSIFGLDFQDAKMADQIIIDIFVAVWISAVTCIWTKKEANPRSWAKVWLCGAFIGGLASVALVANPGAAAFAAFGTVKALLKKRGIDDQRQNASALT